MRKLVNHLVPAIALCFAGGLHAQGVALYPSGYPDGADGPPPTIVQGVGSDCAGGEIYDDGAAENGYSGNAALVSNFQGVSLFTPPSYPATYDTVCIGLVSLGGPTLDLQIQVHDDDGAGGSPGTLLGSVPASFTDLPGGLPCTFYSVDISSLNLNITGGSVHIGVQWNPMAFPSRFICADESGSTPLHPGFVNFNTGSGWQATQTVFPAYRAKLIRALGGVVTDLAVTKTGAVAGNQVTWTIEVSNLGAGDAPNVVVSDSFDACSTFVSDDCGGVDGAPWTWTVGTLANGASATCNVIVDASACPGPTLSNTASVASDALDPEPANDSDTAQVTLAEADLAVSKSGALTAAAQVTWTIQASNLGPDAAANVVVSDAFDVCSTYISDDCGGVDGAPWTWSVGTLAASASVTCNVVVDTSACAGTSISNTATISSDTQDPDATNNSATAQTSFGSADLSIVKSGSLTGGSEVTWILRASNAGPDNATGVVVADMLAACSVYLSDTCGGSGAPAWTWAIGDLAAGATLTCNLVVDVAGCDAPLGNTATISGNQADLAPGNNTDSARLLELRPLFIPFLGGFGLLVLGLGIVVTVLLVRRQPG